MSKGYKRRRWIVNKLHARHTARFILFIFIVTLLIITILLGPLYIQMMYSGDDPAAFEGARHFLLMTQKVVPVILLLVVSIIIFEVVYSHRFFGPLHRLDMWFKAMKTGDLTDKGVFRKHDQIHYIGRDFNDGLKRIRTSVDDMTRLLDEVSVETEPAVIKKKIDEAKTILADLKT